MKKAAARVLSVLMMIALAYFMTANTVFMHSHRCADGNYIAHSHPYVPSSHHTHSAEAFGSIATFNLAPGSFDAVASAIPFAPSSVFVVVACVSQPCVFSGNTFHFGLRAPPM